MAFNFGADFTTAGEHTVAKSNYLQGDQIHIVKLKEAKADKVKLKDGGEVDIINVIFENEEGATFEDKTFELTQDSLTRNETQYGVNPSQYDSTVLKFRCYIEHLAPKYNEKLLKGEVKLEMKTWKQFRDTMVALLTAVAKQKTPVWCKLKLVKYNNFASLPFFAGVNKDGVAYIKNNFIGNVEILEAQKRDIIFSASELKQIAARTNAANNTTSKEELPTIEDSTVTETDINPEDFENMTL